MAETGTVTLDTARYVTAAVNLLHAAFIKAPRAQAKRHFARVHGGATLDLARLTLEGRGDVLFRVALDHSEYIGKIGFAPFRKQLDQLLHRLADRVRLKLDIPVFASDATGELLFNVPAVLKEEGTTNVLMLGVGKPEPGITTLRLQFLDPEQFRKPAEATQPQA